MQVNPCPICGSRNVRWRARRWSDFVLTFLAYLANMSWLSGSSLRWGYRDVGGEVRQQVVEERTGLKTARYFWKCPDCRNKGSIFEEPPPDLALPHPPQQ